LTVSSIVRFSPFRLDLQNHQLWRDDTPVSLRPKAFAVLQYLVERAGHLVTRDELVAAVWNNASGAETAPKHCIRELRAAFGDGAGTPRFIESVGRIGYRFVAPLAVEAGFVMERGATQRGDRRPLRCLETYCCPAARMGSPGAALVGPAILSLRGRAAPGPLSEELRHVEGCFDCFVQLRHLVGITCAHLPLQSLARNCEDIVEVRHTANRQALPSTEDYFGWQLANGSGDECDNDRLDATQDRVPGQDYDRPIARG